MGWITDPVSNDANDDWRQGQSWRPVRAACCPQCGSTKIHHKGVGRAGTSLVYWDCLQCEHRWKTPECSGGRVTTLR